VRLAFICAGKARAEGKGDPQRAARGRWTGFWMYVSRHDLLRSHATYEEIKKKKKKKNEVNSCSSRHEVQGCGSGRAVHKKFTPHLCPAAGGDVIDHTHRPKPTQKPARTRGAITRIVTCCYILDRILAPARILTLRTCKKLPILTVHCEPVIFVSARLSLTTSSSFPRQQSLDTTCDNHHAEDGGVVCDGQRRAPM